MTRKASWSSFTLVVLLAAASLSPGAENGWSQRVELTPAVGYQVGGEMTRTGEFGHAEKVDIEDSKTLSLTLGYHVSPESLLELTYAFQPTRPALAAGEESPDLDIHTLLLGGSYHWQPDDAIDPYIQLSLGGSHFDLAGIGATTRFASAFGGGARLRLSQRVGVRLDARVLSTYSLDQGQLSCRPGVCYGWTESSWMNQFAVSAGLIVRL